MTTLEFQSLQGIWFDRDTYIMAYSHSPDRFNPYKGFGSIATLQAAYQIALSEMFQSLQGIWFDRDLISKYREDEPRMFQSLQGIWFDRDLRMGSSCAVPVMFQSLQGIWFDRDLRWGVGMKKMSCFNPYKGFGSIATQHLGFPCAGRPSSFNPYKGFGSIATKPS